MQKDTKRLLQYKKDTVKCYEKKCRKQTDILIKNKENMSKVLYKSAKCQLKHCYKPTKNMIDQRHKIFKNLNTVANKYNRKFRSGITPNKLIKYNTHIKNIPFI